MLNNIFTLYEKVTGKYYFYKKPYLVKLLFAGGPGGLNK